MKELKATGGHCLDLISERIWSAVLRRNKYLKLTDTQQYTSKHFEIAFLGTRVQLYKSGLCGKSPLNTDFEALAVKNSLRLVLTMSLWSVGRLGRENKVSDTLQLHSVGEFPRPILGNLNMLKSPCFI